MFCIQYPSHHMRRYSISSGSCTVNIWSFFLSRIQGHTPPHKMRKTSNKSNSIGTEYAQKNRYHEIISDFSNITGKKKTEIRSGNSEPTMTSYTSMKLPHLTETQPTQTTAQPQVALDRRYRKGRPQSLRPVTSSFSIYRRLELTKTRISVRSRKKKTHFPYGSWLSKICYVL